MWRDANWAPMAKSRLPRMTEQPAAAEDVRLMPLAPLAAQMQDLQVEAQAANSEKSADIETRVTTLRTLTIGATSTLAE